MSEKEPLLTNRFTEKLKEEIQTLRHINNKGRTLLKVGIGLAGLFAIGKLSQGSNSEAALASVIAGSGLLILTKDPLAWTIETKEALLEDIED